MDEFEEIAAELSNAELSILLVRVGLWFSGHEMAANKAAVNEAAKRLAQS